MHLRLRELTTVAVAVLLVATLATPAAAASQADEYDEPALVVELEPNGDATMTAVFTYDLESDSERQAFEALQNDSAARDELETRFTDRMSAIAETVDGSVDRDVSVTAGSIDLRTEGDRGIAAVSVEWTGLAAVEDGQLVVTEPFASGTEFDRAVVLVGPDDSTFESATPEPTTQDDRSATWAAGTDLSGFEATFALSGNADGGGAVDGLPGFGTLAATLALGIAVVAIAARTRPTE